MRAGVEGAVELDGQALKSGVIRFIPTGETRGPAATAQVKDGIYRLPPREGPLVGMHRVEIEALDFMGFALDDEKAFVQNIEQTPPEQIPKNPVPETYNRNSNLTRRVEPGVTNKLDFQLVSNSTPVP